MSIINIKFIKLDISSLRKSPKIIRALYEYLVKNKIPAIIDNKLHPIFNKASKTVEEEYGKVLNFS